MKYAHITFLSVALILTLFSGCSRNPAMSSALSPGQAIKEESAPAPELSRSADTRDVGTSAKMLSSDASNAQTRPDIPAIDGRKLIYTASLTIAVPDVQDTAKKLETQLAAFKAYTASQDWYENSVSYEIKVPVDQFNSLMDSLGSTGKIRRKNVQARDVTEYYYDLENRLKNKRILVERYQTYLKNAKNVEDLLNVERFLNDATTELESLEGNFRGLVKQVEYATISLTLESQITTTTGLPTLGERLRDLLASFGNFLQTAVVIAVALVIYGIPLVLILALLWLLLFGRIGLVKKLFSLVSKK